MVASDFFRSNLPEVFLRYVLKMCSKLQVCRSVISIKLQSNFIEITRRYGCSPVNFLLISRTPFLKNTSEWLPLKVFKTFRILPGRLLNVFCTSDLCSVSNLTYFSVFFLFFLLFFGMSRVSRNQYEL